MISFSLFKFISYYYVCIVLICVYISVFFSVCTVVFLSVCAHVCVCVCMYVFICVHICVHACLKVCTSTNVCRCPLRPEEIRAPVLQLQGVIGFWTWVLGTESQSLTRKSVFNHWALSLTLHNLFSPLKTAVYNIQLLLSIIHNWYNKTRNLTEFLLYSYYNF